MISNAVAFWRIGIGDSQELFKIGYNKESEPVEMIIVDSTLARSWMNSNKLGMEANQKLLINRAIEESSIPNSNILIKNPEFIKSIIDLYTNKKDEFPEIKLTNFRLRRLENK